MYDSFMLAMLLQSKTVRFICVGGIGFVTNFALLFGLHGLLKLGLLSAQLLAVEGSIIVTFLFHHHWTYRHGGQWLHKLGKYNLTASIGAVMNTVLLWGFAKVFMIHYLVALTLSAGVVMLWNYLANQMFIWRTTAPVQD